LAAEAKNRLGAGDLLCFLGGVLLLCLLFWNHGPLGRLVGTLGMHDPVFTQQFWATSKAKDGQPAAAAQARADDLSASAAKSGKAVIDFLSGDTKYLMDYYNFRQIPTFLFLAFLAGLLGMRCGDAGGQAERAGLILYVALGLTASYMAIQAYNFSIRQDVSLGFGAAPLMLLFYYFLFSLAQHGPPPGRIFWRLALLVLLLDLPVLLIATALHVNRNYFAAYFFQPFQWFGNFVMAFAVVHCLGRRDRTWTGLTLLGILLWLALSMDAWNHFSFWSGLRDIKKVSIGLFYRP
jgi:hypothetical protein